MSAPDPDDNLLETVHSITRMVTGFNAAPEPSGHAPASATLAAAPASAATVPGGGFPSVAMRQGSGLAAQSVAQSMAIAVQDAVDLMRNVSTIETTAIGAATAKWINEPENVFYPVIIKNSTDTMTLVATLLGTIGTTTAGILAQYEKQS